MFKGAGHNRTTFSINPDRAYSISSAPRFASPTLSSRDRSLEAGGGRFLATSRPRGNMPICQASEGGCDSASVVTGEAVASLASRATGKPGVQ
jgi:hypothetical protein